MADMHNGWGWGGGHNALNKSRWYLCKKKLFCLWTFSASFFTEVAPFIIEIDFMKKKIQIQPSSGFSGTPWRAH